MDEIEESPVPPAVNNDICNQFSEYDRRYTRRHPGQPLVVDKAYCRAQLGMIDGSSYSSFRYSMLRIILLHTHLLTIDKLGLDNIKVEYSKEMRFYMIKRVLWFVALHHTDVPMVRRRNGKTISYIQLAKDRFQYLMKESAKDELFPKEERKLVRKLLEGSMTPEEYYEMGKEYHL